MHVRQYLVILYCFFWVVRINGCIRRGRQPLLRGREWFFNVLVGPDFYAGAGGRILHRYWLRMLLPFAVDLPCAIAIFVSGHFLKLPDFLHQSEIARWPVCYQPAAPMLVLKGARGYSLNLGNRLAHFGAAYLAGLVAIFVLLPLG